MGKTQASKYARTLEDLESTKTRLKTFEGQLKIAEEELERKHIEDATSTDRLSTELRHMRKEQAELTKWKLDCAKEVADAKRLRESYEHLRNENVRLSSGVLGAENGELRLEAKKKDAELRHLQEAVEEQKKEL